MDAPATTDDGPSGEGEKPPRRSRFDPVARYEGLEAEMFRLKFERAQHIEKVECQELKDRQSRNEIERLKERLGELDVELDGIVMKGQAGSSEPGALPEEVVVEEGLRLRKEKVESSHAMLEKDVANMRSELESERERFAEVSERQDKAESDHYRADSQEKALKSTGERLSSEQTKLQSECTAKSVELSELREGKEKAEEELEELRDKISILHAEQTKLQMRLGTARDQTRAFRHDEAMSKRQSNRVKDRILAIKDPQEYRKQRPQRRARRRREKAEDAAWAASERELSAGGEHHPLIGAMLGRRHSNEGAAGAVGSVYVPHKQSSLQNILPGTGRRRSNDDADGGRPRSVSVRSILPGIGRRHSNDGPSQGGNDLAFLPGSWKKDSNNNSSGMSVVSGLTVESRTHGGPGPLFRQR